MGGLSLGFGLRLLVLFGIGVRTWFGLGGKVITF